MIDHLKHMADVRPPGPDHEAVCWALNEIRHLRAALKPLAVAAAEFDWVTQKGVDSEGVFLWCVSGRESAGLAITAGDAFRARRAHEQSASEAKK